MVGQSQELPAVSHSVLLDRMGAIVADFLLADGVFEILVADEALYRAVVISIYQYYFETS